MIVEMIARQVGEGAGQDRQPFGAILVEAMARRFEGGVGDAFAAQARHVGEEGDDVGRGKAGRHLIDRGGDAQRADRRGFMAQHPPQLAGEFDRAGLAVRAGDRDGDVGEGREEARRQLGEEAAGIGVGDMECAVHLRFGAGDDGDGAGPDRFGNIILAIDAQALKGAENGARRDLAIVDRKTGYGRVEVASGVHRFGDLDIQLLDKRPEAHHSFSFSPCSSGIRSEISTSRRSSGITPSIGPVRSTTRLTTGAAVQAAVRRPNWPVASSMIATTT